MSQESTSFSRCNKRIVLATSSKGFKAALFLVLTGISVLYLFFYDDYTNVFKETRKIAKNELARVQVINETKDLTTRKSSNASVRKADILQQRQPVRVKQIPRYVHHVLVKGRVLEQQQVHKNSKECIFPNTDPFDPGVKKIVNTYPSLDCSNNTANVVYLEDDIFRVNRSKLSMVLSPGQNFSHCWCKEVSIVNGSDKGFEFTNTTEQFHESMSLKPWQENVVAECFDASETAVSRSYFPLIRKKVETEFRLNKNYRKHIEKNSPLETLSIFMIGIDGMSKQNFERAMPRTRNFLLDKMGAIELYKYNKLAFETFPNVLALLSGHTPEEFYRDWHYNRTEFVDQINEALLWSEARKIGYRTGMILDCYDITAFHYQKKGFKVSPVDYYQRPTVIASSRDTLMRGKNHNCVGDMPEITQVHDYWLQMAQTFGKNKTTPFFAYSFAARLTHDESDFASKGDEAYFQFLNDLMATDSLNNTVILWFSDHGPRFGPIRESYHGRIETSTPYLFFIFPPWFYDKYPKLISTLKVNQNRLASHFDVYETLKDLLYFKSETLKRNPGTVKERGISLFREIPVERTCANAGIPGEFCACGRVSKVLLSPSLLQKLSAALLNKLNSFIGFGVSDNDNLKLQGSLQEEIPSNKSTRGGSAGNSSRSPPLGNWGDNSMLSSVPGQRDGKLPCAQLSLLGMVSLYYVTNDQLKSSKVKSYRVTIRATPGLGLFEGLVNYEPGKEAQVVGDIVRINMYRGQADCVHDPWLRQFCFCVRNA